MRFECGLIFQLVQYIAFKSLIAPRLIRLPANMARIIAESVARLACCLPLPLYLVNEHCRPIREQLASY